MKALPPMSSVQDPKPLKRYLDTFARAAGRARASLQEHRLEVLVGSWLGSSALKVQKPQWTQAQPDTESEHAGIFFSVWVDKESQMRSRAFYNIHALRLRNLSAYSLQSREFAAAFRARFVGLKGVWPNISVEYGPQTLMQGWISLDEDRLEEDVARLALLFIPLSAVIDDLLNQRRADCPKAENHGH